ncbi:hypothetical protein KY289_009017 [Solanum tuberosum]|nr:hypothetical protein KY289_009017 [Solanum tuberosum]
MSRCTSNFMGFSQFSLHGKATEFRVVKGDELKQGYSAQKHALMTAKNLKLLMSGGKESKLAIYEPRSSGSIFIHDDHWISPRDEQV